MNVGNFKQCKALQLYKNDLSEYMIVIDTGTFVLATIIHVAEFGGMKVDEIENRLHGSEESTVLCACVRENLELGTQSAGTNSSYCCNNGATNNIFFLFLCVCM